MAEIYQLPENSGNNGNYGGLPFSIPIGGNGNGLFGGNGQTNLLDLFGFAIIASIFGWGNNGFGGGFGGGNGPSFNISSLNILIHKKKTHLTIKVGNNSVTKVAFIAVCKAGFQVQR